MSNYSINILHLYPDLLNLYGDKGNIQCLRKRLEWRGINVSVNTCTSGGQEPDVSATDIVFLGGGADRELGIVSRMLLSKKQDLKDFVENGGTMIALCSGFPLIGNTFVVDGAIRQGLGIIDITTHDNSNDKRLTGNVVLECEDLKHKVIGFENHGCRTDIGDYKPLGKVVKGFGNNGISGYEGVIYKNLTATYLHGPLLLKNPELCDQILSNTLKRKYPDFDGLLPLEDSLEIRANEFMEKRI